MTTIGTVGVRVTADTSQLVSGLKEAGRSVNDFDSTATALAGKLKNLVGPAAIAAGAAFAGRMVMNVAAAADALGDLSERTGIAVEDLSRLQYVAQLSGGSAEVMSTSLIRLSRGMSEAASGTGEALKAFQAMGIEVQNADGTMRSQTEVLEDVADRFATYEDGAQKTALAMQIFGRQGAEMIGVLNRGSAGIRELSAESDALGNTLTEETAKAAGEFNDNIDRMSIAVGGITRQIAGPLIQALADLTAGFFKAHMQGASFFGALEAGVRSLAGAKDLESARLEVAKLEAEMKEMRQSPMFDEASHGAMRLAHNLSLARERLQGYQKEAERAPVVQMPAPVVAPTTEQAGGGAGGGSSGGGGGRAAPAQMDTAGITNPLEDALAKWQERNAAALDAAEERDRAYFEGKAQRFLESMMSETELLDKKFQQDMERLDNSLLSEQEKMAAREQLTLEHNTRLWEIQAEANEAAIEQEAARAAELERIRLANLTNLEKFTAMSYQAQAKHVAEAMVQQLTSVNTTSRAMFNIQKAANIGQAIMDTYAGATRALKDYPAPISYAVAGATIAAGMSRVASIKSQTFGGASAAGAASGGGGVAATSGLNQQGGAAGMNQTVTIQGISTGDLFGGDSVRTLIDRLIDAQRNGARIVLA